MTVENIDYRELGSDIYAEARDGNLTEDEREGLLERYGEECTAVQEETCTNLQELRDAMDIFEESTQMDSNDISKLQRIIQT